MNTYKFDIQVDAISKEEAQSKMQSVCDLLKKLNEKELKKLANIVMNDPIKTAMAKRALGV
jgi:formate dehydrogenase maturation protein FdhE